MTCASRLQVLLHSRRGGGQQGPETRVGVSRDFVSSCWNPCTGPASHSAHTTPSSQHSCGARAQLISGHAQAHRAPHSVTAVRLRLARSRGTFREHALLDVWKPGSFHASGTAGAWSFERSCRTGDTRFGREPVSSHGSFSRSRSSSRSVPRHGLDSSLVRRRHHHHGVSRSLRALLRIPQRTHLPAAGFMASGAVPGRPRAGGAPDRCRGASASSQRPAGRLRPASFSSRAQFRTSRTADQVQ